MLWGPGLLDKPPYLGLSNLYPLILPDPGINTKPIFLRLKTKLFYPWWSVPSTKFLLQIGTNAQ